MKPKKKWLRVIILIGVSLLLFNCFVVPLLNETYLSWKLRDADIGSILIQDGDLPAHFSKGQVIDIPPDEFWEQNYLQHKRQEIIAPDGTAAGGIWAYLYSSKDEQAETYQLLYLVETQEGIIPYDMSEFKDCENCIIAATNSYVFVVFTRCAGIGYISISNKYLQDYGLDNLISHAKRLDESFKSIACQ